MDDVFRMCMRVEIWNPLKNLCSQIFSSFISSHFIHHRKNNKSYALLSCSRRSVQIVKYLKRSSDDVKAFQAILLADSRVIFILGYLKAVRALSSVSNQSLNDGESFEASYFASSCLLIFHPGWFYYQLHSILPGL